MNQNDLLLSPSPQIDSRRLKLTLAYDGTEFHGWQVQPGLRTVQGEVEAAFASLLREPISVIAAGRTDAGVHALGQVAHTDILNHSIAPDQICKGLNRFLAQDVRILKVEEAAPEFHARFSARWRRYRYCLRRSANPLERRFSWRPRNHWDDMVITRAMEWFKGEHCFRSFCRPRPGETGYLCDVDVAEWHYDGDRAWLDLQADRFFHQMIRGIIGALVDLGRGLLSELELRNLIDHPQENAKVHFAPARGLTLMEVLY